MGALVSTSIWLYDPSHFSSFYKGSKAAQVLLKGQPCKLSSRQRPTHLSRFLLTTNLHENGYQQSRNPLRCPVIAGSTIQLFGLVFRVVSLLWLQFSGFSLTNLFMYYLSLDFFLLHRLGFTACLCCGPPIDSTLCVDIFLLGSISWCRCCLKY